MSSLEGTDASPSGLLVTPFSFHPHLASPRPRLPPPLLPPSSSSSSSRAAAGSLGRAVTRVFTLLWHPCCGGTGCDRELRPVPAALSRRPQLPGLERGARRRAGQEIYGLCTLSGSRAPRTRRMGPREPPRPRAGAVGAAAKYGAHESGHKPPFCHAQAINLPGRARLKRKVLGGGGCRPRRRDPAPQA